MSRGRQNRIVGQIGEYLVCAELGRRRFIATPFSGNVPTFDVLATDEDCNTVPIQVKASTSGSWRSSADRWMQIDCDAETKSQSYKGPRELHTPDLVWVCVAIADPKDSNARDRFFVMTEKQLQKVCIDGYTAYMVPRDWKRSMNPATMAHRWFIKDIKKFEDKWDTISKRLKPIKSDV